MYMFIASNKHSDRLKTLMEASVARTLPRSILRIVSKQGVSEENQTKARL